jgi:hypothetical protein
LDGLCEALEGSVVMCLLHVMEDKRSEAARYNQLVTSMDRSSSQTKWVDSIKEQIRIADRCIIDSESKFADACGRLSTYKNRLRISTYNAHQLFSGSMICTHKDGDFRAVDIHNGGQPYPGFGINGIVGPKETISLIQISKITTGICTKRRIFKKK